MIFETKRLQVRLLKTSDITSFYQLESNPKVLQYATGTPKTLEECKIELANLITKYTLPSNNFWIYAVTQKQNNQFIGTVALVKDNNNNNEIGYRLIENFWGKGYGYEVVEGLINYAKSKGISKVTASVINKNIASSKILKKLQFKLVKEQISDDIGLLETTYQLVL